MCGISGKVVAFPAAIVLLCVAVDAGAQGRSQVNLRDVGAMRELGASAASRTFSAYSYGAGSLARPSGGPGGGALGSSIGAGAGFSLRKAARGAAGLPGLGSSLRPNSSVRIYTPGSLGGPVEPSVAEGAGLRRPGPLGTMGAASAYMATFQAAQGGPTLAEREAVSSFAGTDGSAYSSYLAKGEKSFKDGDFDEALREFRMANIIGGKDPESLLSLTHAAFARSVYGYAEAALYLCRALKYFPELPLAKLDLRAFFGQTPEGVGRYAAGMTRLEAHLAEVPTDANAKLLLAYFRWFDGRQQEAVGLLEDVLRTSRQDKNDTLSEAAEIFLDAAQAGGTTRPTQPAAEKQPSPGQPWGPSTGCRPVAVLALPAAVG